MKFKGLKNSDVCMPEGKFVSFDDNGIYETENKDEINFLKALQYQEFIPELKIEVKEVKLKDVKKPDMKIADK
jgi:hypothetical protein